MNPGPATCLICLKNNYAEKSLLLFDLYAQDWNNVTYLNKLQNVLSSEITVFEETLICSGCLDDLNKAYEFKERVIRAIEYWSTKFQESVTFQDKITEEVIIDINDNKEASEPIIYTEDIVNSSIIVIDDTVKGEPLVAEIVKEVDSQCTDFPCDKCSVILLTASELIDHVCGAHIPEAVEKVIDECGKERTDLYKCESCNLEFSKAWKLNKHLELHATDLGDLDLWSARFDERVNFQEKTDEVVVIDVNDNKEVSEQDIFTEDIINASGNLVINDITENTPVVTDVSIIAEELEAQCTNFPCNKCNLTFLEASELVSHNCCDLTPKEPEEELESCNKESAEPAELCDNKIHKPSELNKNTDTPLSDKKFVCTYCNHCFKQSYHLREHLTTHTGERNYTCEVCGKKFQRMSSQKRHMRTHNSAPGEKSKKTPFLCNICGKSFPYSNGAQRHMRIHTGDKRYECNLCNKKFNQSTHLKVHLRTHTGERPYVCKVCGENFSLKASLRKHINGHREKKNDVQICPNLEPNLSQRRCKDKSDDKRDYIIDDLPLYEQGFLIACSQ